MTGAEPVHFVDLRASAGSARTLCGKSTREPGAWPFVSVDFVQRNIVAAGLTPCPDCARQLALDEGVVL